MLRIWLGHGASGNASSMTPWVDGLRALGFDAHPLQLPRRRAEDAVAALEAQVPDEPGMVIGGHSFGGRVASLAAAGVRNPAAAMPRGATATEPRDDGVGDGRDPAPSERKHPYAALVCLSYPLHPPGKPERAAARTAHWPRIDAPALLLSGTSDPFARIGLLEASVAQLQRGTLVTYPRLGHNVKPMIDDALGRIAEFLAAEVPGASR